MLSTLFWLLVLALAIAAPLAWARLGLSRRRRLRRQCAAARRGFEDQRAELGEAFRRAASATGKPRGLAWESCELAPGTPILAVDGATGELVALAGVTIAFSAVPGGDMEEVEAVGALRDATAVYAWRGGQWRTDGRAVFNLSPEQTLARYHDSLTPV